MGFPPARDPVPSTGRSSGTTTRRTVGRVAVALLLALPPLGLAAVLLIEHGLPGRPRAADVVLALGDSVPAGASCGCQPFPQAYGALLAHRLRTRVTVDNRAVSGLDTAGVIAQLQTGDVADAVRRADVVLLTIGANDFGDHHDQVVSGVCGSGDADCVSDELESLRHRLAMVLSSIRTLRRGQPTTVLVTGYWNVFEDGEVARRTFGAAGLRASLQLTHRANRVIESVATEHGARYVDLLRAFQRVGPDVTPLMASDGDHPNAAGQAVIAHALLDAGLPRLT